MHSIAELDLFLRVNGVSGVRLHSHVFEGETAWVAKLRTAEGVEMFCAGPTLEAAIVAVIRKFESWKRNLDGDAA